jgi:hypothetical protein
MPYTDAGLKAAVDGIAATGNRIMFFTGDPGTTGANEISGTGRPATTWNTGTNGVRPGSQVSAPIPAGTTVTHWGIGTAATGGTFLYGTALSAPETFGNAGTIQHTPTLTVTN